MAPLPYPQSIIASRIEPACISHPSGPLARSLPCKYKPREHRLNLPLRAAHCVRTASTTQAFALDPIL